jgi:hypothetical protein
VNNVKTKYLTWLAVGLLAGAVPAHAGPLALAGASAASSSEAMPFSSSTDYSVFVGGTYSVDPFGDPQNDVRTLQIGASARVIGIGWDVSLFADAPSWLSEMVVAFGSTSAVAVNLTPGVGDDSPGTQAYSSGGVVDLVGLGLDFTVDADGVLRMEFFESFDDFADDWDGIWESGSLTIRVEDERVVPEPSLYALLLLGLAGVAGASRRRVRQRA